jgi:hypothetical protein
MKKKPEVKNFVLLTLYDTYHRQLKVLSKLERFFISRSYILKKSRISSLVVKLFNFAEVMAASFFKSVWGGG